MRLKIFESVPFTEEGFKNNYAIVPPGKHEYFVPRKHIIWDHTGFNQSAEARKKC